MTITTFEICIEGFPFYSDLIGQIQSQFMDAQMQCKPEFPPLPSCPTNPFGDGISRYFATLEKWLNSLIREYFWIFIGALIEIIETLFTFPTIIMPIFDIDLLDLIAQNFEAIYNKIMNNLENLMELLQSLGLPSPLFGNMSMPFAELWEAFQLACAEFMQTVVMAFYELIETIKNYLEGLELTVPAIPPFPDFSEFSLSKIIQKILDQFGELSCEALEWFWDTFVKDMVGGMPFPELCPLFPNVTSKVEEFFALLKLMLFELAMYFFKKFLEFIEAVLALLGLEFPYPRVCFPMIIVCPTLPPFPEPPEIAVPELPEPPEVPPIPKPEDLNISPVVPTPKVEYVSVKKTFSDLTKAEQAQVKQNFSSLPDDQFKGIFGVDKF